MISRENIRYTFAFACNMRESDILLSENRELTTQDIYPLICPDEIVSYSFCESLNCYFI